MENKKLRRENNVKFALGINSLDGVAPSNYCKELIKDYIDGKIDSKEVTKKLIDKYKE